MNANFRAALWFAPLLLLTLGAGCTQRTTDPDDPRYLVGADFFPVAEAWGAELVDSIYVLMADSVKAEAEYMSLWNRLPTGDSLAVEIAFLRSAQEGQKGKEAEVLAGYFQQASGDSLYSNVQFIDGKMRILYTQPIVGEGKLRGVWAVRVMRWALVDRMRAAPKN